MARMVETRAYLSMLARITKAAGARVSESDEEDLRKLVEIRGLLDDAIGIAVMGLRESGYTWRQIGAATDVSHVGALKKWGR